MLSRRFQSGERQWSRRSFPCRHPPTIPRSTRSLKLAVTVLRFGRAFGFRETPSPCRSPAAGLALLARARALARFATPPASLRHGYHPPCQPAFRSWSTQTNRPSNTAIRLEGRHKVMYCIHAQQYVSLYFESSMIRLVSSCTVRSGRFVVWLLMSELTIAVSTILGLWSIASLIQPRSAFVSSS